MMCVWQVGAVRNFATSGLGGCGGRSGVARAQCGNFGNDGRVFEDLRQTDLSNA